MKKLVAVFALCLAGWSTASAQQSLMGPGAAFLSVGASRIATGDLDDRLAAGGYPTFGNHANSAGIGAYRIVSGRVLLGGELNGLIVDQKPHLGREVGVGGGYATLALGYVTDVSPRVRVYPRLGLGVGGLSLWVRTADTTTFDALLANPTPPPNDERVLTRDGGVIDFGAGAEFLPKGHGGGPLIGVRAGYLLAAFGSSSNWWTQDGTATGGPKASISGPYIRVVLGGAWRR
jgi:hypothetical protein